MQKACFAGQNDPLHGVQDVCRKYRIEFGMIWVAPISQGQQRTVMQKACFAAQNDPLHGVRDHFVSGR